MKRALRNFTLLSTAVTSLERELGPPTLHMQVRQFWTASARASVDGGQNFNRLRGARRKALEQTGVGKAEGAEEVLKASLIMGGRHSCNPRI